MHRFKVGILGSGVISRTYAADIMRFYSRKLDLCACADVNRALAEKLAAEFGIPKAYTTEELLADPEIEIVINLTPPQLHVELAGKIIRAGKHLFSEKPFAPTLKEAQEILALAEENGVRVGCAPDTFLASGLQSLKWYLDAGIIGDPFFVTANMTTYGYETWHPNPAPFYKKGSGPMSDMAPYYLSAMAALFGSIETVTAFSAKPAPVRRLYVGENAGSTITSEVDTHYSCLLRFANGVIANLTVSFDIFRSNLPMFEIYGTGGTLSYPDPNFGGGNPKVYRREQHLGTVYQDTPEAQERKEKMYELPELYIRGKDYSRGIGVFDLACAIEEGRENRANGELVAHVTEAIEGILISAETGRPYSMTTACRRPESIPEGRGIDEV